MLENALSAQNTALDLLSSVVHGLRISSAMNKKLGSVPLADDEEAKISEVMASMMIARENIMRELGREELFKIRPLYPPLDPSEAGEFSRKVRNLLSPK
jgi:hypothetical protein